MSDVEFQRELSPDQLREALSLLDSTAGMKIGNLQVGDLNPGEEVDLGADQASTTTAMQGRLPAAEDSQHRTKHLNLAVVAFGGLGIAAATALTLLSWNQRSFTPPPLPEIAHEQLPNHPAAQLVTSVSPTRPVANPPADQSPGGSERPLSKLEGASSSSVGQAIHSDDHPAARDAVNNANAMPYTAQMATVTAVATKQTWSGERASRKPREAWWHARAVRVAAAKKRFWRRHWQAGAEVECVFFVCLAWQTQRAFYEPPRNVTQ
jgi:hypothetical protein